MEKTDTFRKTLAEIIENDNADFEDSVERARSTGMDKFAHIMMERHDLDYETALKMVVECCWMRRGSLASYLKGDISREEWRERKVLIDNYIIKKYTSGRQ